MFIYIYTYLTTKVYIYIIPMRKHDKLVLLFLEVLLVLDLVVQILQARANDSALDPLIYNIFMKIYAHYI